MRYVSALRWMVPNNTCPTASAFGDGRRIRGRIGVADDRRGRTQPDLLDRSESRDDRVRDADAEILVAARSPLRPCAAEAPPVGPSPLGG